MKLYDGIWKLMKAYEWISANTMVYESIGQYKRVNGSKWVYMKVYEVILWYMNVYESIWM